MTTSHLKPVRAPGMPIRRRALGPQAKRERHRAILDAAERALLRFPGRPASMAEVAKHAGLAKGTLYLYFPGRAELLLALHERRSDAFFQALDALLETASAVRVDDVVALMRRCLIEPPPFPPLSEQTAPAAVAAGLGARMNDRLGRAGAALERRFRELASGDGAALLRHSYALILGLAQMAGGVRAPRGPGAAGAGSSEAEWSRPDALDRALRDLWEGTIRRAAGARHGGAV